MLAYQSTQQVSLLGGGASIVIYIVIFVFVHIPSLTILYIVNVSTVSLLQMDIAFMHSLLQVHLNITYQELSPGRANRKDLLTC